MAASERRDCRHETSPPTLRSPPAVRLRRLPVPTRRHRPCRALVPALRAVLPRRRGAAGRARRGSRSRHHLPLGPAVHRNRPVRAGHRRVRIPAERRQSGPPVLRTGHRRRVGRARHGGGRGPHRAAGGLSFGSGPPPPRSTPCHAELVLSGCGYPTEGGLMAAAATARAPAGTVQVVDPHPLNWLFITWNTMEEPVRTDQRGHIVGAAMEDSRCFHSPSTRFWEQEGFGYRKRGTGEGHW